MDPPSSHLCVSSHASKWFETKSFSLSLILFGCCCNCCCCHADRKCVPRFRILLRARQYYDSPNYTAATGFEQKLRHNCILIGRERARMQPTPGAFTLHILTVRLIANSIHTRQYYDNLRNKCVIF